MRHQQALWKGVLYQSAHYLEVPHVLITFPADTEGKRSLEERLSAGEHILCAEGYLLALCQRGYIAHGVFVPEFILEQPQVLKMLYYEFIHAGTDVIEAFQVNLHW